MVATFKQELKMFSKKQKILINISEWPKRVSKAHIS